MSCPSNLTSVCADGRLRLRETINEPSGTVYGIAGGENDVFVICRWREAAPRPDCEATPRTGAEVVGQAAAYRVVSG